MQNPNSLPCHFPLAAAQVGPHASTQRRSPPKASAGRRLPTPGRGPPARRAHRSPGHTRTSLRSHARQPRCFRLLRLVRPTPAETGAAPRVTFPVPSPDAFLCTRANASTSASDGHLRPWTDCSLPGNIALHPRWGGAAAPPSSQPGHSGAISVASTCPTRY